MSDKSLELAVKKQRLLLASAELRGDLTGQVDGLAPAFSVADGVISGAHWLKQHPEIVVTVSVALVVARPRVVWRWARRVFSAWQVWNKVSIFIQKQSLG